MPLAFFASDPSSFVSSCWLLPLPFSSPQAGQQRTQQPSEKAQNSRE
jgi:hypothetical protein